MSVKSERERVPNDEGAIDEERFRAVDAFSAAEAKWLAADAALRGLPIEADNVTVDALDEAERAAANIFMRTPSPGLQSLARKIWALEAEATEVSLGREIHTLIGWLAALRMEVLNLTKAAPPVISS